MEERRVLGLDLSSLKSNGTVPWSHGFKDSKSEQILCYSLGDTIGLRGVPGQQGQEKIRHQALLWVLAAVSQ